MNRESRIVEEEKQIRINMVKNLCIINSDEDLEEILKCIEPLLRNKKRFILLMGGNYEEESEEEIVSLMTTMPIKSV